MGKGLAHFIKQLDITGTGTYKETKLKMEIVAKLADDETFELSNDKEIKIKFQEEGISISFASVYNTKTGFKSLIKLFQNKKLDNQSSSISRTVLKIWKKNKDLDLKTVLENFKQQVVEEIPTRIETDEKTEIDIKPDTQNLPDIVDIFIPIIVNFLKSKLTGNKFGNILEKFIEEYAKIDDQKNIPSAVAYDPEEVLELKIENNKLATENIGFLGLFNEICLLFSRQLDEVEFKEKMLEVISELDITNYEKRINELIQTQRRLKISKLELPTQNPYFARIEYSATVEDSMLKNNQMVGVVLEIIHKLRNLKFTDNKYITYQTTIGNQNYIATYKIIKLKDGKKLSLIDIKLASKKNKTIIRPA
jgi:hypothetical protein